jgi:hypothetical protein
MTDTFRALCAELADALDAYLIGGGPSEETADIDDDLITRARTALAQPAPLAEEEVGELVAALRDPCVSPLLMERTRAADLLERLAQPEAVWPTDDAELRTVYAMGAEARWREGFPEAWSLTDMERAAHTAGLRAVLARLGRHG